MYDYKVCSRSNTGRTTMVKKQIPVCSMTLHFDWGPLNLQPKETFKKNMHAQKTSLDKSFVF